MSSIEVSYENSNFIITKSDGNNITFQLPIGEFNNPEQQLIIRKLDCIKDAFSISNTSKIKIMRDIFRNIDSNNKVDLDFFKNGVILENNKDKIEPYSWLKSSSLGISFDIKYVFHETGLSPEDYIKNLKFTSNSPSFEMVGSFQSEIGDPFNRKSEKISFRYPSINTSLTFDESFMNFFGFENTTYSSTLVQDIKGESGVYDYKITLNNGTNVFSSKGISKESTGTSTPRFPQTPNLEVEITDCKEGYTVNTDSPVTGNEYFKGNTYKNAVSQALYNSTKGTDHNINEIKRYIIGKELGDVMQVLLMMIWQNDYLNSISSQEEKNKSFCMSSNDSIVFLLCNMMEQPCFYTSSFSKEDHFKLTGKQKIAAIEGKFYNVYYYTPKSITSEERMKTRFEQTYNEIRANNLKIQKYVNVVSFENIIYIGSNKIDFSNNANKKNIIQNNFLTPIKQVIEDIIKEANDFFEEKIANNTIENLDIDTMASKYLLLPFISLVSSGKGYKKINKFSFNPKIKDYTASRKLLYNENQYSFQDLFIRFNSGTMKGGSTVNERTVNIYGNEGINLKSNSSENIDNPLEKSSSFIEPISKDEKQSSQNMGSEMVVEENDEFFEEIENLSNLIPMESEDTILDSEPVFSNDIFTDKVFLTFINQVVEFIDNPSNNLSLQGFTIESDAEEYSFDDSSVFYFYYNLICYICYIHKRVYYDDELLNLMKSIQDYFSNKKSIQDLINGIYIIPSKYETEIPINVTLPECSITNSKSPKAIQYTQELFDTFQTINAEPLDTFLENYNNQEEMDIDNQEEMINVNQEEMDIDSQDKNDINNEITPEPTRSSSSDKQSIGTKRSREIDSDDEDFANFKKGRGGKTIKRKRSVKKHRKTRKGGSHKNNKKRSMKKKASRRKRKSVKKGL